MHTYFKILCLGSLLSCTPYHMHLNPSSVDTRTLFQRKTQVAFREAAEALTDSNHRGLKAPGLSGASLLALQDIVDQSCTNQPGGAVVTIKSSESNSFQMDTPEKNYKKDVFVNAEVQRSYTMADDELECARRQPIIEVDLDKDLVNLKLEVKHHREEKTYLLEFNKPQIGEPANTTATATAPAASSRQMSAVSSLVEGTRSVTFTAALGEVDDDISYSKESEGTSQRKETVESSDGVNSELNFTIQSQFKMIDTYYEHAHDRAVGEGPIRKEVKLGVVKSMLAGQGYVETTFSDLKLEFTQGACKATSGKVQSRYFEEGGTTPVKTVNFDVASNSVSISDTLGQRPAGASLDEADILSSLDLQKELCSTDAFMD